MKQFFFAGFGIFAWIASVFTCLGQSPKMLTVPGFQQYCHIDTAGISVLPSGRWVHPAGKTIRITHDPFGLAISPDGLKAVTLHDGVFTIIDLLQGKATRVPDYAKTIASPFSHGSFLGVAFGVDSKTIYLSGGDNGAVMVYDLEKMTRTDSISLNGFVDGSDYADSFTADLLYLAHSGELLVLDRGNFRMVRINTVTRKITASIATGRQPFGLAVSPDGKTAFVANVGVYSYPLLKDATPSNYDSLLIPWHPYADNSRESVEGTMVEGKEIPGVGTPLSPEAMSVYGIDLLTNKVVHRLKTGMQVGQMVEGNEVVGGASPNSIAVGKRFAYISNATNDNIAVIDYRLHKIVRHIPIRFHEKMDHYRGLIPFGITLSRDEKTLYVALLGLNAVAVMDAEKGTSKGFIPTGWGPTRVRLSPDEKTLYVTSCRGFGAGPNGGKDFIKPVQGTYIGDIQLASFQQIPVPGTQELSKFTRRVKENTFQERVAKVSDNPLPPVPGLYASPIRHIVYITKENRSYDEVLGQLPMAKGDATLARYGLDVSVYGKTDTLLHADIMPNHSGIAKQFSFSDNFYCDSDASIHGHHWMVGVIPNEWVEANSSVTKSAMLFSKAPGRRFPGSTGSIDPEDYAETGGLWEALERSRLPFYNFGEANETAHVRECWHDTATGASHGVMVPMQKALWHQTSHRYAGFNTNIPDQFRMEQFEEEFSDRWLKGKDTMPALIALQVPNDHGAGARADDGYPYAHSYMADNDLALGRILHFLSRTPYWKSTLVIITEDDPQGGVDHIDAHRSILMMAGPYVKRGHISTTHANFGSILKVIYNILGVKYVNQYDVTATLLQDFFTGQPDFRKYDLVFPDKRIFDPEKAMIRFKRQPDWKKILKGPEMDDETELRKAHYLPVKN